MRTIFFFRDHYDFVPKMGFFKMALGSKRLDTPGLEHPDCDQHGLSLKRTNATLLYPWERHFTILSPAWWSWQAVLIYIHIFIKLKADKNILVSLEAGQGNCLPYVLAPLSLFCESGR